MPFLMLIPLWDPICPFCVLNMELISNHIYSIYIPHCIKVATTVEQLDSQSNCLIEQLRILLRSRCNEYVINGFTYDEITELVREIACH